MQSVKAYCKNNVSRLLYLHLYRIKYRSIFVGIVKPNIQFSFTFALTFHYICRISEAVRHSQAENVIFACLCAHLSLYLWNVRVEWHSWKYDSLLPLHFSFTIFELKLEDTSALGSIKLKRALFCSTLAYTYLCTLIWQGFFQ